MPSNRVETRMMKPSEKKDVRKLRSILFDTNTPFTLSPIQVLIFCVCFIFMVFMLHLISRIFPSLQPSQLFFSLLIVTASIIFALFMQKK